MNSSKEPGTALNPKAWVSNYGDLLFAYTYKRVQQREWAEDIVQDVFLSAWKARDRFDHSVEEKTWLFVICQRKIIDHYRSRRPVPTESWEAEERADDFFLEDGHFDPAFRPGASWGITIDQVVEKEFFGVLRKCASRLKQIQEQVFSLKYLNELEREEICSILGITDANYWVLMHRAKVQIRTCLEKNWIK